MNRNSNTLIKITIKQPINQGVSISSLPLDGKSQRYQFPKKGQLYIPYQQYLIYRDGNELAEIDLKQLIKYPKYQHHLHIKTYNQIQPFSNSQKILIIICFVMCNNKSNQYDGSFQFWFFDADICQEIFIHHNMDIYIKMFVEGVEKWKSKTVKNGEKHPNFNRQSVTLTLQKIEDGIRIQLWKQQLGGDDFVGGLELKGYELIGKNDEKLQYPMVYMKNNQITNAGVLRFQVNTPCYF